MGAGPFGYGLSYTTFTVSQPSISTDTLLADEPSATVSASVTVKNTGSVAGDEVVFMYKKSDEPVKAWNEAQQLGPPTLPSRELVGFSRVTLAPGAQTVVHFNTTAEKLSVVDEFGTRHVLPGAHELIFSRGHGEELSQTLRVEMPAEKRRLVVSSMVGLFDQTAEDLGLSKEEL